MIKDNLHIDILQMDIVPFDKDANLQYVEKQIQSVFSRPSIFILPEMFQTGFTSDIKYAEPVDGKTFQALKKFSIEYKKIIVGSWLIEENNNYYNRLFWMFPNGVHYHYDKKHLFPFAGEKDHLHSGNKQLITSINSWKIKSVICYDLRFPIWCRQQYTEPDNQHTLFDVMIVIASWPASRNLAWQTLLQARAIENQCFVIGVNRIGEDHTGIKYCGNSCIIDPQGNILLQQQNNAGVFSYTINKQNIQDTRRLLPFLTDRDQYLLL